MFQIEILLILGLGVFGGTLGASLFQKAKVPQVVGYILIGLFLGKTGLNFISESNFNSFSSLNQFALGIIGFLVGGELQIDTFKKYGKQFTSILLGEGLLSFLLVTASVTLILYLIINDWKSALAAGVVFGAIASATDPASTVSVLWEYRAKGILTTSIIAIVALDDALAMTLYGVATALSQMLTSESGSLSHELFIVCKELFGAIFLGISLGLLLNYILRKISHEKLLVITLGTLLLLLGFCQTFHLDSILGSMTLGFVISNKSPKRTEGIFAQFRLISSPIYVIFFVLVGARINLWGMPPFLWLIISAYVIFRSIGKVYGTKLGASYSNSNTNVQKYLGMSLFAQGGIAIGLSATAGVHLNNIEVIPGFGLGDTLISGITVTTLLVQLLGPAMVKKAVFLSKENDLDINESDIISKLKVSDVVKYIDPVHEKEPLSKVVERFSSENILTLPVVNDFNQIVGSISIDNMKELLADQESWNWILTADVMEPLRDIFYKDTELGHALNTMNKINAVQVPVLKSNSDKTLLGVLTVPHAKIHVSKELMNKHKNLEQVKS